MPELRERYRFGELQDNSERACVSAWEEFGHAQLGDRRRTARLVSITTRVLERPAGTIQGVFDNLAELHGAYDFVENDLIDPAAMMASAAAATARRASGCPFVWIATDGTSRSVTDRTKSKDTGRLGANKTGGRGDLVHSALVLDPRGVPLGIAALEQWQRDAVATSASRRMRTTEQKETQRWLDARNAVRTTFEQHCPHVLRHYLHDRGADAWPVILDAVQWREDEHSTIRAAWDRRLWNEDAAENTETSYLRAQLEQSAVMGTFELPVSAAPKRAAREATIEVRACEVTLDLENKRTSRHHTARIWVICAREASRVPAGEQALEWLLLTTYPVHTFDDAIFVIEGYSYRWRIEQFHQAWKSAGTDVESSQLEAADHRERWSIILAVVAATLLRWQLLAVSAPETPAEQEFTAEQIDAVRDLQEDGVVPEEGRVTLWQVIVALAYLGGWAGSKTRAPGVTVIARGWRDVTAYLRGKRRAAQRARRRLTTPPDDGAAQ